MDKSKVIIFVVDDDESVRKSVRRLLCAAGFVVETFASGDELLLRMPCADDGVLILDLRMPVMNGLELQAELSRRGNAIPVIFMTAHDDDAARDAAMTAGAIGFIRKPFDEISLFERIRLVVSGV